MSSARPNRGGRGDEAALSGFGRRCRCHLLCRGANVFVPLAAARTLIELFNGGQRATVSRAWASKARSAKSGVSPNWGLDVVGAFVLDARFGLNAGFALWLDYGPPRLRDPEYGKRLAGLQARLAENPGRPLVLAIGSSRTAMGVRPGVLETDGGDPRRPLLFNMALAGSGPIMELMVLRRALADGVKPAAVLVEFWPAFLREDGAMNADTGLDVMLRHLDALIARLGEEGVALGSDFDGAVIPREIGSAAGLQRLVEAMLAHGYGRPLVRKIAHGNWLGVLERTWAPAPVEEAQSPLP